ncbi:MAG TPA: response regulator transcription factor [Streptosporangiaceae bacterium]|nr:response regulator transcription factor [Streptosporangiaceae bacterium]
MDPTRVLIVDDHTLFAEALAARLSREPDLVILPIAPDVRRAFALVTTERPHVLALDLMLGAENGLEVLDHVRDKHPDIRVVVLTAVSDIDTMAQAIRRGAVGWLPKTESADLVARVIRSAARRGGWIPPDVLGEVLRRLIASDPPSTGSRLLAALTPREREVLQCMVDGFSRAEIAGRLTLSANTVRTHTQNLLAKLDLHSALEAITLAMRAGMRPRTGVRTNDLALRTEQDRAAGPR